MRTCSTVSYIVYNLNLVMSIDGDMAIVGEMNCMNKHKEDSIFVVF